MSGWVEGGERGETGEATFSFRVLLVDSMYRSSEWGFYIDHMSNGRVGIEKKNEKSHERGREAEKGERRGREARKGGERSRVECCIDGSLRDVTRCRE